MREPQAVRALAHESRLRIFRLLTKCGTSGMPAGKIADSLQLPAATLSFHLKELMHAGLILDRRAGRSIYYSLDSQTMAALLGFLLQDCCGGRPELCGPVGLAQLNATVKAGKSKRLPK